LFGLLFDPKDGGSLSETSVKLFTTLHDVTSQKVLLFIHRYENLKTDKQDYVEFEIVTAVSMNSATFWVLTHCSPVKINPCKL
jgi:hypothetical protein